MANSPQSTEAPVIPPPIFLTLSDNKRLLDMEGFAPLKQLMDEMTTGPKPPTVQLFKVLIEKKRKNKMSLVINPYDMYGFKIEFNIGRNKEFLVTYEMVRRAEIDNEVYHSYQAHVNGDVYTEYHHTLKVFLDKIPNPVEEFQVQVVGRVTKDIRTTIYPMMKESFGSRTQLPRVKKFTMTYSGKETDEQDVMGFLPYVQLVDEKHIVFRQEDDFASRSELRFTRVFGTVQWADARELTLDDKFWCNFGNRNWWRFERAVLECDTLRRADVQAFIEHIFQTNRLPVHYTIHNHRPSFGPDEVDGYYRQFTRDFTRGFGQHWYVADAPRMGDKPMDVGIKDLVYFFRRS